MRVRMSFLSSAIDQHVAAHDYIELAQHIPLQQVQLLELYHALDLGAYLPATIQRGREELLLALRRQPATNRDHFVLTFASNFQNAFGYIRCSQLHVPEFTRALTPELLDDHGHRVRLLPRGTGSRPDPQRLHGVAFSKLWQQLFLKDPERVVVAEPQGFVGRHRVDDQFPEIAAPRTFELPQQIPECC